MLSIFKISLFVLLMGVSSILSAQFAAAAGQAGSTAIHKDSSIILAWATNCSIQRGPMDISQPHLGLATAGQAHQATGAAGDGFTVSLGDGGQATLTFEYPIRNGNGPDFVVFENAFNATFLELALVEVSSDGQNFVRFPAISNTDTNVQVGSFGAVDPRKIYNLAGKYRANYGTPFDLAELQADSAILDLEAITHVRLIDAVGSMHPSHASRDSRGVKINDPWATPFPSSGFDLDAVGVLHNNTNIAVNYLESETIHLFPNPILQGQELQIDDLKDIEFSRLQVYNLQGQLIVEQNNPPSSFSTQTLTTGVYIFSLQVGKKRYLQKVVVL
ncbi:T9SS type A sorting domain-containing protein [Aureispira anguillae]|uniref:T9SS type A sorting domain-containing protein n=1 Tax=Aureispira anguillae TaxID=2864201 RepID=A0A915YG46_9BACT|nr:T9SS type A sorting domain-containing protein [Aureispira anguillae]BDS12524.1 T9SS type A sorting domain-containing protein [Aureispira anguillae]